MKIGININFHKQIHYLMFIGQVKAGIRHFLDYFSNNSRQYKKLREHSDQLLSNIPQQFQNSFEGTVLIDAGWDNLNYWLRLTMIRTALGLQLSAKHIEIKESDREGSGYKHENATSDEEVRYDRRWLSPPPL